MTSVETVRTIPLIIEKDIPMEADNIDVSLKKKKNASFVSFFVEGLVTVC